MQDALSLHLAPVRRRKRGEQAGPDSPAPPPGRSLARVLASCLKHSLSQLVHVLTEILGVFFACSVGISMM